MRAEGFITDERIRGIGQTRAAIPTLSSHEAEHLLISFKALTGRPFILASVQQGWNFIGASARFLLGCWEDADCELCGKRSRNVSHRRKRGAVLAVDG